MKAATTEAEQSPRVIPRAKSPVKAASPAKKKEAKNDDEWGIDNNMSDGNSVQLDF